MSTSSRLPRWTAGRILAVRMALSCIACCILHVISIPFNCSDTAFRFTEAMMGPKFFVFRYVRLVSPICRQNSSPGSLAFSHLGNRAEISHMNPRQNSARSTTLMWRGPYCESNNSDSTRRKLWKQALKVIKPLLKIEKEKLTPSISDRARIRNHRQSLASKRPHYLPIKEQQQLRPLKTWLSN